MNVAAIIPVAGTGSRFPGSKPKQFLEISGQPVVAVTIQSILSVAQIQKVVVVCSREMHDHMQKISGSMPQFAPRGVLTEGGKERQDSVYNGLKVLNENTDVVLVHDGVRPLVSGEILQNSIQVAHKHGACVAAVPVKDTIKRVKHKRVLETLKRDELWQIQTPQTARYQWLKNAHDQAIKENFYTTDEAALLEWQGYSVHIIDGDYKNIKITTPEDLKIARLFYKEMSH
jgi:2-C-methyl-D-erythritol 4-phosphate cytidylyltransferase